MAQLGFTMPLFEIKRSQSGLNRRFCPFVRAARLELGEAVAGGTHTAIRLKPAANVAPHDSSESGHSLHAETAALPCSQMCDLALLESGRAVWHSPGTSRVASIAES